MNIAEILKNTPRGTKLYSPAFGEVTLKKVAEDIIVVDDSCNIERVFFLDGRFYKDSECVLFPSRENRDWNNFYICPFKKGNFIVKENSNDTKFLAIFSRFGGPYEYTTHYLCLLRPDGKFKPNSDFGIGTIQEARLATDSEKKELLDAMARNGYYWDECSMTLNKLTLKFKVGDTIHKEGDYCNYTIKSIEQDRYICESGFFLRFVDQHEWEIKEIRKFDIKELKPFDKVLARDNNCCTWRCDFYSNYRITEYYPHRCMCNHYIQCIPYNEETKHLVGTTEDCPEYYKTW